MMPATEIRSGMAIRLEGQLYRVEEAEAHAGSGKLSGFVHARLVRLDTGTHTERRFRLDEKVEALELSKRTLEFSYHAGEEFYFMDPESFEQIPLPMGMIGDVQRFLKEGMRLPVEFLGDQPVTLLFPETVELRVTTTGQAQHATQTSSLKEAILENGMEVHVPLFIKEGELIRIAVKGGKYVERAREGKR